MEQKPDIVKMEARAEKSRLVGVSMLVLSLLLTASVASLIYVAVSNGNSDCETANQETSEVDVSASVNVKSEDDEVDARVEYSRGDHMSYIYGSNGEFDFDDFRKGFHLTRDKTNGICYLIPVGTEQSVDGQLEGFLKEWNGKEFEVTPSNVEVQVFDGKLTDVSFLPQKVQDECTSGYQWVAVISKADATDKDGEVSRKKRADYCHTHCYIFYCYNPYPYVDLCYQCIFHCSYD